MSEEKWKNILTHKIYCIYWFTAESRAFAKSTVRATDYGRIYAGLSIYLFFYFKSSAGYISFLHKERHPETGILNYYVCMPQQNVKTSHKKQHEILQSSKYVNCEVLQVQPYASKTMMQL